MADSVRCGFVWLILSFILPLTAPKTCRPDQFSCPGPDGGCYSRKWLCDGNNDCNDGADEKNCTTCQHGEFLCNDGQCISKRKQCDTERDCEDGSDEDDENCPLDCPPNMFGCTYNRKCIREDWLCDTINDCGDSADESNCGSDTVCNNSMNSNNCTERKLKTAKNVKKKECNEEFVNNCYQQFNQNATPICVEVKQLRRCISNLTGCHAMKHRLYVLSWDILEKNRHCFIVNYSKILEVLKKKETVTSTEEVPADEQGKPSSHLPYTFVVVATVCTCLFLVVLVVFSVVRHTTLTKRQRNSTVEGAPLRIRIQSQSSRPRTRHHRHRPRHNSRRQNIVVQEARQTVSGFFEGNVPPPPYSAVLDDSESIRAGDPPPPYRPPSCIGVIV